MTTREQIEKAGRDGVKARRYANAHRPGHHGLRAKTPRKALKLPYLRSFRECVEVAAAKWGVPEHVANLIVTTFVEELTKRVALGESVSVPGLGLIGPNVWVPRMAGREPVVYPAFSAAQGFRREVANSVSPHQTGVGRQFDRHRRKHHLSNNRDGGLRKSAVNAVRRYQQLILKQAKAEGFDDDSGA